MNWNNFYNLGMKEFSNEHVDNSLLKGYLECNKEDDSDYFIFTFIGTPHNADGTKIGYEKVKIHPADFHCMKLRRNPKIRYHELNDMNIYLNYIHLHFLLNKLYIIASEIDKTYKNARLNKYLDKALTWVCYKKNVFDDFDNAVKSTMSFSEITDLCAEIENRLTNFEVFFHDYGIKSGIHLNLQESDINEVKKKLRRELTDYLDEGFKNNSETKSLNNLMKSLSNKNTESGNPKPHYNWSKHTEPSYLDDMLKSLIINDKDKVLDILSKNSFYEDIVSSKNNSYLAYKFLTIDTDLLRKDILEKILLEYDQKGDYIYKYITNFKTPSLENFIEKYLSIKNNINSTIDLSSKIKTSNFEIFDKYILKANNLAIIIKYMESTINKYNVNLLFVYATNERLIKNIDNLFVFLDTITKTNNKLNDKNNKLVEDLFYNYYHNITGNNQDIQDKYIAEANRVLSKYFSDYTDLSGYVVQFLNFNIDIDKVKFIRCYLKDIYYHKHFIKLIQNVDISTYKDIVVEAYIEKIITPKNLNINHLKEFYNEMISSVNKENINNLILVNLKPQLQSNVFSGENTLLLAEFFCNIMNVEYGYIRNYLLSFEVSSKEIFLDIMNLYKYKHDYKVKEVLLDYDKTGKLLLYYVGLSDFSNKDDLIIVRDKILKSKEESLVNSLLNLLKTHPELLNEECINVYIKRSNLDELILIYNNVSNNNVILKAIRNQLIIKNNYKLFEGILEVFYKENKLEEYYSLHLEYIKIKINNNNRIEHILNEIKNNKILSIEQKYEVLKKFTCRNNCKALVDFYKTTSYGDINEILNLLFKFDYSGNSLYEITDSLKGSNTLINLIFEKLCENNINSEYIEDFLTIPNIIIPSIYLDNLNINKLMELILGDLDDEVKNSRSAREQLENKLIEIDLSGKYLYKLLLSSKTENGYKVYKSIIEKKNFYSLLIKTKFKKIYGAYLEKEEKKEELKLEISVIDELMENDQLLIVLKKIELKILKLRAFKISDVLLDYVEETVIKILNSNRGLFKEEVVVNRILELFSSINEYLTSLKSSNDTKNNYLNKNDAIQSSRELEDIINTYKSMTDENKYTDYLIYESN